MGEASRRGTYTERKELAVRNKSKVKPDKGLFIALVSLILIAFTFFYL